MRLFVAVWPDPTTSQRLSSLELGDVGSIRPVPFGQHHITLRFLGEVAEDLVPPLVGVLEEAADAIGAPIRCEAGPTTAWFPGGRVLQIPVAGLEAAAGAVRAATGRVVPTDRGERFTGHLTVARARAGRPGAALRDALAGIPFAAAFEAQSFDLVGSRLGAGGPRYTPLVRVPLRS